MKNIAANRRRTRRVFPVLTGIIAALALGMLAAAQEAGPSGSAGGVTTLVGRKDEARVVEKDGTVREVPKKDLVFVNRSRTVSRPAKPQDQVRPGAEKSAEPPVAPEKTDAAKPPAGAETPPGKRVTGLAKSGATGDGPPSPEAAAKAAQARAEEDKANATKQSDIERLRGIERQGGWFYDKDGKPISSENLDKRIEQGDVAGIKTTDIYLQEWKTESKEDTNKEVK
jgi:hypothetical protein